MIRSNLQRTIAIVGGTILAAAAPLGAQTVCGPGPHFVDGCPAGTDDLPSGAALVALDTAADGNLDGDPDVNLVLSGPTSIARAAAAPPTALCLGLGPAPSPPHDTEIQTEIVSMALTSGGLTLTAGQGLGSGPALPPGGLAASVGAICEQPAQPARADSFFDVFFEIGLGDGSFLYNQVPLRVETVIAEIPPDATYIHVITAPIPLYPTPDPQPGQQAVAQLVTARHVTRVLVPLIPTLGRWGLGALVVLLLAAGAWLLFRRGRRAATAGATPS